MVEHIKFIVMANIGDRVTVCMRTALMNAPWLKGRLVKPGIPVELTGTVKRIASNGKIGVQFDKQILTDMELAGAVRGAYNLHGAGRSNYSLYVVPEAIIDDTDEFTKYVRSKEQVAEEVHSILRKTGSDDVVACI
jgi:hypothetical protein